jgi:hypothetical protein
MKSLLSLRVIVPSKSVKKMNLGFAKGQFMAFNSEVELIVWYCVGMYNLVQVLGAQM